jgi:hypothetical protein
MLVPKSDVMAPAHLKTELVNSLSRGCVQVSTVPEHAACEIQELLSATIAHAIPPVIRVKLRFACQDDGYDSGSVARNDHSVFQFS